MGREKHLATYRRLTGLYPGSFRHEYRSDLVELFGAQMEDEGPVRVWLRAIRDLAVTVPTQQLEVRMDRPSGNIVTALFSIASAASVLLALVLGSAPTALLFLSVAIATGAVAFWSFSASRSARPAGAVQESWWKFLLAGLSLAAATAIGVKIPWPSAIDLGDFSYWLVVVSGMTSITLVGTGLVLAIARLIGRQRGSGTGASIA